MIKKIYKALDAFKRLGSPVKGDTLYRCFEQRGLDLLATGQTQAWFCPVLFRDDDGNSIVISDGGDPIAQVARECYFVQWGIK